MTKKIPLAIDAKPFAQAIDKSARRTMTKNIMTNIAEILAVALVLLLGAAILSL
jgi:ABC-type dipeptide/oligopeptide/nickel transport system permease subunit